MFWAARAITRLSDHASMRHKKAQYSNCEAQTLVDIRKFEKGLEEDQLQRVETEATPRDQNPTEATHTARTRKNTLQHSPTSQIGVSLA